MPSEQASPQQASSDLSVIEKLKMFRGLLDPNYFKQSVRPIIFNRANGDPERVHELVLDILKKNNFELSLVSGLFNAPEELRIDVYGKRLVPFGSAAGLDKTGDPLLPLSNIFGFLEPGTICVNPREGNPRPRVVNDDSSLDLYNAQGFPGKGLDYFLNNLKDYKMRKGKVPVYVNMCGMPLSEQNAIELAMEEMRTLLKSLEPYCDGFVWNCASPNTEALRMLRTPEISEQTSALMKELAPEKLRLVKIWPYEPEEKEATFRFIEGFMDGGGHGVVAINTKIFPREQVPAPNWGYKSAGRSGKFLRPYRLRSVKDIRSAFPDSVIVAAGGIFDGDDAYATFKAGANMLEGYTPYTFYGLGLLKQIENGVAQKLRSDGYKSLADLQANVREGGARADG
ncbi:MAG: hypothetical protein KGH72_00250 [Candidatus Micrarchaeota archaeon]|nr:hypothetical protein [Candidatus Micrarchaeota archaeon]